MIKMKKLPLVSVIINTKNEEQNIDACLLSISLQDYAQDRVETIVIDNNSTDRTKQIARQYTKKVFNKGPERSAQRNYGIIEQSTGKYIMYLDAGMILSSTLVRKAVKRLENSKLVGLYIPEIVLGNSLWCKARFFERSFCDGTELDALRFFRKEVFIEAGGFDENLWACEDWDLDRRIKKIGEVSLLGRYNFEEMKQKIERVDLKSANFIEKLVKLSDDLLIYSHDEREFSLRRYAAKKGYYTGSFEAYIKKWGRHDPVVQKQFGLWYRYFGVFTEEGKWRRLIKHPVLTGGMYFLRLLVGTVYFHQKLFKE